MAKFEDRSKLKGLTVRWDEAKVRRFDELAPDKRLSREDRIRELLERELERLEALAARRARP